MKNKSDDEKDDIIHDGGMEKTTQELVQCPACLRRMRSEVFSKHPNVCRENPIKQRNVRVFDMTQYRSIRSGDQIIPVRKVLPSSPHKSKNNNDNGNIRPSQTRSAKRGPRSDALIPPVINNFCT